MVEQIRVERLPAPKPEPQTRARGREGGALVVLEVAMLGRQTDVQAPFIRPPGRELRPDRVEQVHGDGAAAVARRTGRRREREREDGLRVPVVAIPRADADVAEEE